jgi:hypothetical protein
MNSHLNIFQNTSVEALYLQLPWILIQRIFNMEIIQEVLSFTVSGMLYGLRNLRDKRRI